jgi:hypothetical protein
VASPQVCCPGLAEERASVNPASGPRATNWWPAQPAKGGCGLCQNLAKAAAELAVEDDDPLFDRVDGEGQRLQRGALEPGHPRLRPGLA